MACLRRLFFSLLAAASLAGCNLLDHYDRYKDPAPGGGPEPVRLFDPGEALDRHTDPATLLAARVERDVLVLHVSYSGGCAAHDFDLFASRAFLESFPPQADLLLSHEDHDDPCDAVRGDTLRFDLTPLKQVYLDGYQGGGPLLLRLFAPGGSPQAGSAPFQPPPVYDIE